MTVTFRNILLIFFAFTIASCASINPVEKLARKVIFYPDRVVSRTPQSIGLSFEDIYFMSQDKMKLNGWLIKSEENQGTLLFFHGNAGNISHRLEKIMTFHRLGLNVLSSIIEDTVKVMERQQSRGFIKMLNPHMIIL